MKSMPRKPDYPTESYGEARFGEVKHESPKCGAERRVHARYSVELEVNFGSEHNFYVGLTENLSAGGIFVATHIVKPVGDLIEFSINLPGRAKPIRGTGEVRWTRDYSEKNEVSPGLGLRFITLEPEAKTSIERFLKQREPMFFDET